MGRLGAGLLEPRSPRVLRLDGGQPGAAGHQDPPLVPREFPDYPRERKALIPFIL